MQRTDIAQGPDSVPEIFVSGTDRDCAVILDVQSRHLFCEVPASREFSAREMATRALAEFRAETGHHPRKPNDATAPDPFAVYVENFVARVSLCEEAERNVPTPARSYYSSDAAHFAAKQGQLPNYLQALALLSNAGVEGAATIDVMNEKIIANRDSEAALLRASAPGTNLDGMMRLNVQQVMLHAANVSGLSSLAVNPPAFIVPSEKSPAARGWALAELLSPWWAKHSVEFLSDRGVALDPTTIDCPGLTYDKRSQAVEVLNGLRTLQGALTKKQPGVALTDVAGYGDQWKSLFVLSYLSPHAHTLASAAGNSAPLARTLRSSLNHSRGDAVPLPESIVTRGRPFRIGA